MDGKLNRRKEMATNINTYSKNGYSHIVYKDLSSDKSNLVSLFMASCLLLGDTLGAFLLVIRSDQISLPVMFHSGTLYFWYICTEYVSK